VDRQLADLENSREAKLTMDRRKFLRYGVATIPVGLGLLFRQNIFDVLKSLEAPKPGRFIFSPSMQRSGSNTLCSLIDLETLKVHDIEVPLSQAHSAVFDPKNPDRVFIFDATGPSACEVSLSRRRCERVLGNAEKNTFGGHGVFLGGTLFTGEARPNGEGRIVGRDSETLNIVSDFPTGGMYPHEIGLSPDKKYFVVMNEGGGKGDAYRFSNLTFVDVKTGMVYSHAESRIRGQKFRHFTISKNGDVCVAAKITEFDKKFSPAHAQDLFSRKEFRAAYEYTNSMMRYLPTPLYFFQKTGLAEFDVVPDAGIFQKMRDSNSIAINEEKNIIGVSHSGGHMVTFWDAAKRTEIQKHDFGDSVPRGIIYHPGQNCFFLHTMNHELFKFSDPLRPPERVADVRLLGFAHLTIV
jgi:hypothetical protein